MGLGSTAKKLQTVVDMADELYSRINDLREQMNDMKGSIETTNTRVAGIEAELAEQRVLLEAIVEHESIEIDEDAFDSDEE